MPGPKERAEWGSRRRPRIHRQQERGVEGVSPTDSPPPGMPCSAQLTRERVTGDGEQQEPSLARTGLPYRPACWRTACRGLPPRRLGSWDGEGHPGVPAWGGGGSPCEPMVSLWGLTTCAPPDTLRTHHWGPSVLRMVWEGRTEWRAPSSRREWRVAGDRRFKLV